jgi:hypothetical protein
MKKSGFVCLPTEALVSFLPLSLCCWNTKIERQKAGKQQNPESCIRVRKVATTLNVRVRPEPTNACNFDLVVLAASPPKNYFQSKQSRMFFENSAAEARHLRAIFRNPLLSLPIDPFIIETTRGTNGTGYDFWID